MEIISVFEEGGDIPKKYTCQGKNINPYMEIMDVPAKTKSLALIMEDPDATIGTFTHWVAWGFDPETGIEENDSLGISGRNSSGRIGYVGPCPPSGKHRYFFRIYALDRELDLDEGASRKELEDEMDGHVLDEGVLMGRYAKS